MTATAIKTFHTASASQVKTFRVIPGYGGRYSVSKDGEVWSRARQLTRKTNGGGSVVQKVTRRKLTVRTFKSGHKVVTLCAGSRGETALVHRLVLLAYIGPCPEGMECRHLDGNPANNHVSNLVWGTRSQNILDRNAHGCGNAGSRNGHAKLTERNVQTIRQLRAYGAKLREIAHCYNVTPSTIDYACRKHTWQHVGAQSA